MTTCQSGKRYLLEFGSAMAAYVIVIFGCSYFLRAHPHITQTLKVTLALAPVIPCIFAAWAIIRQFRRMDELQQRIQFEALAFSFTLTALGTFSWALLEQKASFPPLPSLSLLPAMMVMYGLGQLAFTWRYR